VQATCAESTVVGDDGCADGSMGGEETDVDCGGRVCGRCGVGSVCATDTDCSTSACSGGLCVGRREEATVAFLQAYLDSDFYADSFAHHLVHGDMGGASYLNPYPIMDVSFCDSVGVVGGEVDCSLIDFDSLLLGGCYCHPCLPENPCLGGGTCVRYERVGYTCDCSSTGGGGDHCQVDASGATDTSFVWLSLPPSPPPPPPQSSSPASTTCPSAVQSCEVPAADATKLCSCRFKWARECPEPVGVSLVCRTL